MDSDCKIDDFVNVAVRIRPILSQDGTETPCLQVISRQPPVIFLLDRAQTYSFDNIFKEEVDQETVYNETVKPLVDYVKRGYSCTVFAYGQTGTGKTYTMGTSSWVRNPSDAGLIPRALEQFFTYCDDDTETDISISFIEIYNEKVFDLLQNNKPPLTIKGFRVEGLRQEKIFNCQEAKHFLRMGNRNRHSCETKQNSNSSRSHAIFTIYSNVRHKDYETTAKLNLVDLAGCESLKKTGNQGSTFQEGVNINKGLLCIGQVMTALSTNANFVPYRQSVITTILQDSLNRKNLVSLIACVNGNPEDCNETIQTLEFAQRVKKMKNKPEVNEVITRYKRDNPVLFQHVRTSCTPFKRPAPLLQTPRLSKRAKIFPLKAINESSGNMTEASSPKSMSSISVSSITSTSDVVPQSFSPVIKKYMAAMEVSLTDRIETLIKNTLKKPSRSSLLAQGKEKSEKENTPSLSWNKIQNEVSKLVRSEIVQLTSKASRATSSPIEELAGLDKIRKVLQYESPVPEDAEKEDGQKNTDGSEEKPLFKVPEKPVVKKKHAESKRTPSVSPIEFEPRRSTRLSLKRTLKEDSDLSLESSCNYLVRDMSLCGRDDVNKSKLESHCNDMRRSLRLAEKRNDLQDIQMNSSAQLKKNYENPFPSGNNNKSKESSDKKSTTFKFPELIITNVSSVMRKTLSISPVEFLPRRSTRLSLKRTINDLEKDASYHSNTSELNFQEPQCRNIRCSLRLSRKRNDLQHRRLAQKETNNNSLGDFDLDATAETINKSMKSTKMSEPNDESPVVNKRRGNVRFNKKASPRSKVTTKLTVRATPAGKRIQNNETSVDSPATAHTKDVLKTLNRGKVKELEKLHTIGPKTAQQILLFRDIRGPLNKISDLSSMPGWHGKKFKIFVEQNFLKDELI
ncbi:kinesin-like protein Nod [Anoplophora glabripennis]|uniref:kinesin-like protein Nod n=1 Tax=Anoplophora glabripennis TaxID=217634 RepID=UPI000874EC25|nr:kinesin-like protein Nod [Anoplophora glabripennis]